MIAEDGEHTIFGLQFRKDALHAIEFGGKHILQIASEDNGIGLQVVDGGHHSFQEAGVVEKGAHMDIAEQCYAVTVERTGKRLK